ncbi:MAG: CHAT domain-containing protein [Calditrichaeota bacterium]|nr:MAG: CHAT domain-containing protein [Calditrichota bacterium]
MRLFALLLLCIPLNLPAETSSSWLQKLKRTNLIVKDSTRIFNLLNDAEAYVSNQPDSLLHSYIYGLRGDLYSRMEKPRKAMKNLKKAMSLSPRGETYGTARWLYTMAMVSKIYLDDISGALDYMIRAGEDIEQYMRQHPTEHPAVYEKIVLNKAEIYRDLGFYRLAIDVFRHFKTERRRYRKFKWIGLATSYHSLQRFDKALEMYHLILNDSTFINKNLTQKMNAYVLNRIGDIYFDRENWQQALHYYNRSYHLARMYGLNSYIWANLLEKAYVYAFMEQPDTALSFILQMKHVPFAYPLQRKGHLFAVKSFPLALLGQLDSAYSYARRSIRILEKGRKKFDNADMYQSFSRKFTVNYFHMKYVLTKMYEQQADFAITDSLLKYTMLSRGRRFEHKEITDTASVAYHNYLVRKHDLENYQKAIRLGKKAGQKGAEALIVKRLATIQSLLKLNNLGTEKRKLVPPVSDIKRALKKRNAGLLVYDFNPLASYALYMDAHKQAYIPLPVHYTTFKDSLNKYLSLLYPSNGAAHSVYDAGLAYYFYQRIWQPLEPYLEPSGDILVLKDPDMEALPLATLINRKPNIRHYTPEKEPDYWPYLILQHYNLATLPGLWMLTETVEPMEARALIVADPADSTAEQSDPFFETDPLLYALAEGKALHKLLPKSVLLTGQKATEQAFYNQAPDFAIWHFATHALYDSLSSHFTSLKLAVSPQSRHDGLLMGFELEKFKSHPVLVTISACKTGAGTVLEGEGTLNLARTFITRGASTVLMAQWDVADNYSSKLMRLFYKNAFKEKYHSFARALEEAKRSAGRGENFLDVNFKHPYFWASYNLFGDTWNPFVSHNHALELFLWIGGLFLAFVLGAMYLKNKKNFFT